MGNGETMTTAKIRIGMRTVGSFSGTGPRVLDVVVEVDDNRPAIEKAIESTYSTYFQDASEHMVRATVTGASMQLDDYLVARMPDGLRMVPVNRPVDNGADLAKELKSLEASMRKAVIPLNALEVRDARELAAKQELAAVVARDEVFSALKHAIATLQPLPAFLHDAFNAYLAAEALTIELLGAVPSLKFTVVSAASGAPVTPHELPTRIETVFEASMHRPLTGDGPSAA